MTGEEINKLEELIATSLIHSGSLGRSEAVMLAHDIFLLIDKDYHIDKKPYLDSYGAALEKVATQFEGISKDIRQLLFNAPKSTDDPMAGSK